MKTALKILGWITAGAVCLFIWYAFPGMQQIVAWTFGAAFAYHIISTIIEDIVKRVLWTELMEIRRQSNGNVDRLESIDRKVSALLKDTLDQRRMR